VTTSPGLGPLRRRLEVGRLVSGSLLELGIKAYGAAAVLSVLITDAETTGGKAHAAVAAVPSLADKYHDVKYVFDHREEIQGAIDYLDRETPSQPELQRAADEGAATLRDVDATFDEVGQAKDAVTDLDLLEAAGHIGDAWSGRPELDSLRDLAATAEQLGPLADQAGVLVPVYYSGFSAASDNLASDEIASTVLVIVAALVIASVLGRAVGFWVRRGRPGVVAQAFQQLGARVFRRWYVRNLPFAVGPEVYAVAREHVQRDIAADPEGALDPETLHALEEHFARRRSEPAP
jgi:hypothetical protein